MSAQYRKILVIALLACGLQTAIAQTDRITAVEKAIRASQALSTESGALRVVIVDDQKEVRVSTFKAKKLTEQDLKIEAVLIAKAVIDAEPSTARVVVAFFRQQRETKYSEIKLTKPQIVAYVSGQVSKEELLASLEIERKIDEEVAAENKRSEDLKKAQEDKSKLVYQDSVAKKIPAETQWQAYKAPGISFEYPAVWTIDRVGSGRGESLVTFADKLTTYSDATLELKLYRPKDRRSVIDEAREHVKNHRKKTGYKISALSNVIRFGVGKALTGVDENFAWMNDGKPYYERHVYFGWPGYVYKVRFSSHRNDYARVSRIFNHLLDTMKIEYATPKSAAAAKAKGR